MSHARNLFSLLCLLLLFAGCSRLGWSEASSEQVPELHGRDGDDYAGSADRRSPNVLPLHDPLTTPEGIRWKVIFRDGGGHALDDAPHGSVVNHPLKLFRHYPVFDARPSRENPQWYLIGTGVRRSSVIGWVPAAQVAEWFTRVGAAPISDFAVYAEPEALIDLVDRGTTTRRPIAEGKHDPSRQPLPWPIAESRIHTTADGRVVELLRLHLLGELKSDAAAPPTGGSRFLGSAADRREATLTVLVFVVDNTQSTEPFLPQIRQALREVASGVSQVRPNLVVGLTLYRDRVEGLYFPGGKVTETHWNGKPVDLATFLSKADSIDTPAISSVDYAECGYDGLMAALRETDWGRISSRYLVWVGDNSAHEAGSPKNPHGYDAAQVVALAKEMNARIFSLCIEGRGGEYEQALHFQQCKEVAEGTGGQVFRIEEAGRIADHLGKVVVASDEEQKMREQIIRGFEQGLDTEQILRGVKEPKLRDAYEFVNLLVRHDLVNDLPRDTPVYASGWVLAALPGGAPLFEKKVFLARAELKELIKELSDLEYLLSSPEMVDEAARLAFFGRTSPDSFFHRDQPRDVGFDVHLAKRGIPLSSSSSLLRFTRSELEHMSESRRYELSLWIQDEVLPPLITYSTDREAFTLLDGAEMGWIPERLLP